MDEIILLRTLINVIERKTELTEAQLAQFLQVIPLLRRDDLTNEIVGDVDLTLAENGLSSMLPIDDALYTTNVRHFAPILAILGKKLYEGASASIA